MHWTEKYNSHGTRNQTKTAWGSGCNQTGKWQRRNLYKRMLQCGDIVIGERSAVVIIILIKFNIDEVSAWITWNVDDIIIVIETNPFDQIYLLIYIYTITFTFGIKKLILFNIK